MSRMPRKRHRDYRHVLCENRSQYLNQAWVAHLGGSMLTHVRKCIRYHSLKERNKRLTTKIRMTRVSHSSVSQILIAER